MLNDKQIEDAKSATRYSSHDEVLHEHNDCIRMAYEWLDAQKKIKGTVGKTYQIKHLIERWCGRYVSTSDVEVAAQMHPDIIGAYPHFNISARLTRPSKDRLDGMGEAFTHEYHITHTENPYAHSEN